MDQPIINILLGIFLAIWFFYSPFFLWSYITNPYKYSFENKKSAETIFNYFKIIPVVIWGMAILYLGIHSLAKFITSFNSLSFIVDDKLIFIVTLTISLFALDYAIKFITDYHKLKYAAVINSAVAETKKLYKHASKNSILAKIELYEKGRYVLEEQEKLFSLKRIHPKSEQLNKKIIDTNKKYADLEDEGVFYSGILFLTRRQEAEILTSMIIELVSILTIRAYIAD